MPAHFIASPADVAALASNLLTDVSKLSNRLEDIVECLDDIRESSDSLQVAADYAGDVARKIEDMEYAIRQLIHFAK